jgi:ribosomal protein S18 acetylase RimI-like enzyme
LLPSTVNRQPLIKLLTKNDLHEVRDLALIIFPETYKDLVPREQIDYMMHMFYSPENLDAQFDAGQIFIMLYVENVPAGYASYTSLNHQGDFKLNKIYVDNRHQGKGIGKKLISDLIARVKAKGARTLQLNVLRNNTAVGFYRNIGFSVKEEMLLDIGHGYIMDDYVMELSFRREA